MKRLVSLLIFAPLAFAGIIPGRYIVELTEEPVAGRAARVRAPGESARAALRRPEAEQQRSRVRAEQDRARVLVEQAAGEVAGRVENVANALLVNIPDERAAQLAQIPGVKKVYPVRRFHLTLDHALPLHKVPEAWSQVGYGNAGAGIKIAIIDTGVDVSHAAFQDDSLTPPSGFPRAGTESDLAYTNGKVIVARSYAALFDNRDPDPSARDHVGHGTATATCAAGVQNTGPLATITGVAPKAWIGSYKVFGTPGVNDSTSDNAILAAIDDAVADGMDIISMSLGSDVQTRLADDVEVVALERAAALGIIVAASSGNNGSDPATVGSPANAPSVLGVGATANDRRFSATATVGSGQPLVAIPGSGSNSTTPISAPLVDVASLDGTGLACASLRPASLSGSIAFILRGVCTFEEKLTYAQAAGAVAALIYTDQARPDPIPMAVGAATLPAEMIGYADGAAIKQQLSGVQHATLQFTIGPAYVNPERLSDFSSEGPSVEFAIKPDLVAVGQDLYMAAQKLDPLGALYSADGYVIEQGTSFSAPIVAGAAAVLKSARPGLTAAQYRSLLINSASPASLVPGTIATVQQAGGGRLDLSAALNATAAAVPASISFGSGTADIAATRTVVISNAGTAADTFTLSVAPSGSGPVPAVQPQSVQLDPGGSAEISVTLTATGVAGGAYEGFLLVQGTAAGTPIRIPYWYGVPTGVAKHITVIYTSSDARAGSSVADAILFKVTDAAGLPVDNPPIDVSAAAPAILTSLRSRNAVVPNAWGISLRLGVRAGSNVVHIQVGDLTRDVVVVGH